MKIKKLNEDYQLKSEITEALKNITDLFKQNGSYSEESLKKRLIELQVIIPKNSLKKLATARNNLLNELKKAPNIATLKLNVRKYLDELNKAISLANDEGSQAVLELINKLDSRIKAVFKADNKYKDRENQSAELINLVKQLDNTVQKIIALSNSSISFTDIEECKETTQKAIEIESELTSNLKSINNTVELISDDIQVLENQNINISDVSQRFENLFKSLLESNETLTNSNYSATEPLIDPKSGKHLNFDAFKTNLDLILTNISKELTETAGILIDLKDSLEDQMKEIQSDSAREASIDWENLLQEAEQAENRQQALADFWTKYYSTEWKSNEDKIRNLGSLFTDEVRKLGFNYKENPFIAFLKATIDTTDLTIKNYAAIHNAYIYKYITDADLAGIGKLGHANLIFNKALYKESGKTILDYLVVQSNVKTNFEKSSGTSIFRNDTLNTTYAGDIKSFNIALFAKEGNPLRLTKIPTESQMPDAPIKKLSVVLAQFKQCFGAEAEQKVNWDSAESRDIINVLRTPENLINAIKYLAIIYGLPISDLMSYTKIKESGSDYDIRNSSDYFKVFSKYNIDKNKAAKIILDLVAAGELDK